MEWRGKRLMGKGLCGRRGMIPSEEWACTAATSPGGVPLDAISPQENPMEQFGELEGEFPEKPVAVRGFQEWGSQQLQHSAPAAHPTRRRE